MNKILETIEKSIIGRSGSIFYSGRISFQKPSDFYILGLNPGGDPDQHKESTIERSIENFKNIPNEWSAYIDESWRGAPGQDKMQRRIQHVVKQLNLDIRRVPSSNVVFVRTRSEADLSQEKQQLLDFCWLFHDAVIQDLKIKNILCLGQTAGRWVREKLNANILVGEHIEQNRRKWRSQGHQNSDGINVFTLTHPSWANWCNPNSDPSGMVRNVSQIE